MAPKKTRPPPRKLSDDEARQVLVLARAACRQWFPNFNRDQKDELIGAAAVGLVEWWDDYDETKATRRSWALMKAHHCMQDYLRVEARNQGLGRQGKRKFWVFSADQPILTNADDGPPLTLAETIVGDDDVEIDDAWLTQPLLYAALDSLPDRMRASMILYARGYKLAEIGQLFGVSETRICQLLQEARKRLAQDGRVRAAVA